MCVWSACYIYSFIPILFYCLSENCINAKHVAIHQKFNVFYLFKINLAMYRSKNKKKTAFGIASAYTI